MSLEPRNILIIKPSALGDIVLALPALAALRKSFPDARITWLVRPEFAPLIEGHPHLDEVLIFDRKLLGSAHKSGSGLSGLISLVGGLRKGGFDLVFDFQGLLRSGLMTFATGAKRRVGMTNAREGAGLFYNEKVEQTRDEIHLVDFFLKMVAQVSGKLCEPEFGVPVDEAAKTSVLEKLKQSGVEVDNYAVLIPGSAQVDKCWPPDRFAQIADKLNREFGLDVVSTGTASEKPVSEIICNKSNVRVANFAGCTTLRELVALLSAAKIVISNDTGPGHIASALGVPLVMLFGWSNPIRLAPYRKPQCSIIPGPDTRGLALRSNDPAHDITNITVDEVLERCRQQIKK